MTNVNSVDDLLEFLGHAASKGLMPAATAQALAVASRNVLGILTDDEKSDVTRLDLDAVVKRFTNKRAKDFNPASLKVYGQRVHRAIDLFLSWRKDPANFTIKTRTSRTLHKAKQAAAEDSDQPAQDSRIEQIPAQIPGTYQSSFPVRPGLVVTLINIPYDLTGAEAERVATFVKMLAPT